MSRYRMDGLSDGFIKGLQIGEAIKTSRVKEQLAGFKAKYAGYKGEQAKDLEADDVTTRLMDKYDIPSDSAAYNNIYDAARLGQSVSSIEQMIQNNQSSWAALEAKKDNLTAPIDGVATPATDLADQTNAALTEAASGVEENEPLPVDVQTNQALSTIAPSADFESSLIGAESGGDNSARTVDTEGRVVVGELQFGKLRLQDYNTANGTNLTLDDIPNLNAEQRKALRDWHIGDLTKWANDSGLQQYVGTEINGVTVTADGILAMAHLGGKKGATDFLTSGGASNPSDEVQNPDGTYARTSLSDYLAKFGGNSQTTSAATPVDLSEPVSVIPPSDETGLVGWFKKKHREKIDAEILIQTGLSNIDTFNRIQASSLGSDAYTPIRRGTGETLPLRLVSSDGSTKGNYVENMRTDNETTYPELGGKTLSEVFNSAESGQLLAQANAIIEKKWKLDTSIDNTLDSANAMLWDTFQRGDDKYRNASNIVANYDPTDDASLDDAYYSNLKIMQERILHFNTLGDADAQALAAKTSYMQTIYNDPTWEATEKVIERYEGLPVRTPAETDAYQKALIDQREILIEAESTWKGMTSTDSDGLSLTYTQANYAADSIKREGILATPEDERSEEDSAFLASFKITERAYLAASAATKVADDPMEMVVTFTNSDGVEKTRNLISDGAGGFIDPVTNEPWNKPTDGETAPYTNVSAMTLAQSDDVDKRITAANDETSELQAQFVSISQMATNAKNLSDKVAMYENTLTTAGSINSLFSSFKTELDSFVDLLGSEDYRDLSQSEVLAKIEGLDGLSNATTAQANVYKQFQADMVRFIFSVGRAEGQAGNGFSNQDYRVLKNSVNSGNNYTVFTTTLKSMVNNHWVSFNEQVSIAGQSPSIINARKSTDVFDRILMPNATRFSAESVEAGRTTQRALDNYLWAQSETGVIQGRYLGPQSDSLPDAVLDQLSGDQGAAAAEAIRNLKAEGKKFWVERTTTSTGEPKISIKFFE